MFLNSDESFSKSVKVDSTMFGGNQLFKYDLLSGQTATYSQAADLLGVSSLRYPGGTMTEINFDVLHPDSAPIGSDPSVPFVGISEFLNFAATTGRTVDIVLPTKKMYAGVADQYHDAPRTIDRTYMQSVLDYVKLLLTTGDHDVGSLPDTPVMSFELGNEYWGGGKMTAREYGQIVNTIVPLLEKVFDEVLGPDSVHPKIFIQMASPLDPQYKTGLYSSLDYNARLLHSNQDIINEITDPLAVSGVSGLIQHYYYSSTADDLVQSTWTMNSIDQCLKIWGDAGFADRDLFITEWNVGLVNAAQQGLKGASIVLEQMKYMLELGADGAFAWPVQGYSNGLTSNSDGSTELSPIGGAFKMMAESVIGTELVPYDLVGAPLEVQCYKSDSKVVFFVSSRSGSTQMVDLDVSKVVSDWGRVEGDKIGIAAGESVTDPLAHAVFSHYSGGQICSWNTLKFNLAPFEVMRVVFDRTPGALLNGTPVADLLSAGAGNDTVSGDTGGDTIVGDFGSDQLTGGGGSDRVFCGRGDDFVQGGIGADTLVAISGKDTLYGNNGNDFLSGGTGSAALYGGNGNDRISGLGGPDTLAGGPGSDTLIGGDGVDHFVFESIYEGSSNIDLVVDFHAGLDKIVLDHQGFGEFNVGTLEGGSFAMADSLPTAHVADQIVYDSDTGTLALWRAESTDYREAVQFANIGQHLAVSASDFLIV